MVILYPTKNMSRNAVAIQSTLSTKRDVVRVADSRLMAVLYDNVNIEVLFYEIRSSTGRAVGFLAE